MLKVVQYNILSFFLLIGVNSETIPVAHFQENGQLSGISVVEYNFTENLPVNFTVCLSYSLRFLRPFTPLLTFGNVADPNVIRMCNYTENIR
jgi:hypothetical protein